MTPGKRRLAIAVVAGLMGLVLTAMVASVTAVRYATGLWGIRGWSIGGDGGTIRDPGSLVDVRRTIPLNGDGAVSITGKTNTVTVRGGGTPGQVTLTAQVRLPGGEASSERVDRLLGVSRSGGELRIAPPDAFNIHFGLIRFMTDGARDLSLEVPDGVFIRVRSDTGRVALEKISGPAWVRTNVGTVEVNGIRGDLTVRTDVGRIAVRDAEITGPLHLESDTGAIEFQGLPGPDATLATDVGRVDLRLPGNRAYALDLTRDVGRFSTDLPYDADSGRLGTGEPSGRLRISTSVGAVRINEEGD